MAGTADGDFFQEMVITLEEHTSEEHDRSKAFEFLNREAIIIEGPAKIRQLAVKFTYDFLRREGIDARDDENGPPGLYALPN